MYTHNKVHTTSHIAAIGDFKSYSKSVSRTALAWTA